MSPRDASFYIAFAGLVIASIAVGYGVGHALFVKSGRVGGRGWQLLAVPLAYVAVSASVVLPVFFADEGLHGLLELPAVVMGILFSPALVFQAAPGLVPFALLPLASAVFAARKRGQPAGGSPDASPGSPPHG